MESVGSVLFAYYVCDAIAQKRQLTTREREACEAAYDAVRIAHLNASERRLLSGGPEARAKALALGRARFEAWCREHPGRVAALREAAAPLSAPAAA